MLFFFFKSSYTTVVSLSVGLNYYFSCSAPTGLSLPLMLTYFQPHLRKCSFSFTVFYIYCCFHFCCCCKDFPLLLLPILLLPQPSSSLTSPTYTNNNHNKLCTSCKNLKAPGVCTAGIKQKQTDGAFYSGIAISRKCLKHKPKTLLTLEDKYSFRPLCCQPPALINSPPERVKGGDDGFTSASL